MKLIKLILLLFLFNLSTCFANDELNFEDWKMQFKQIALSNNISKQTFDTAMADVRFLPKVIEYDRFQPEFYEDTKTYVDKRTSTQKLKKGINFYKQNIKLVNVVENSFGVLVLSVCIRDVQSSTLCILPTPVHTDGQANMCIHLHTHTLPAVGRYSGSTSITPMTDCGFDLDDDSIDIKFVSPTQKRKELPVLLIWAKQKGCSAVPF